MALTTSEIWTTKVLNHHSTMLMDPPLIQTHSLTTPILRPFHAQEPLLASTPTAAEAPSLPALETLQKTCTSTR